MTSGRMEPHAYQSLILWPTAVCQRSTRQFPEFSTSIVILFKLLGGEEPGQESIKGQDKQAHPCTVLGGGFG